MRYWNENAISEMISLVLVLFIATGAITSIMVWGAPYMEEQKITGRWESALLQLNVMGDIIEDIFAEGINSSKKMNFQTNGGQITYDDQSERFVIYYSVYTDYDLTDLSGLGGSYYFNRFNFSVRFTEDKHNFYIRVGRADIDHIDNNGNISLGFTATRLDGSEMPVTVPFQDINVDDFNTETEIGPFAAPLELSDAVKINITCRDSTPTITYYDYGRIWLFDVGSLTYQASGYSNNNRIIIENGAVIAAHRDSGNMYNEPAYWSQKSLEGTAMMAMRVIQMNEDKNNLCNVGGSGPFVAGFSLTTNNSTAQVNRCPISYPLKMKIYGDDAAVFAWHLYYMNEMGFREIDVGGETNLEIDKVFEEGDNIEDLLFSLNHAIYNVGMEVK